MWRQILSYFYIRKRTPGGPRSVDVRLMHGMNRIALVLFLIAVIVMIMRLLRHG